MVRATRPIAIVRGAAGWHIQQLFREFVDRWQGTRRIVGVIEEPGSAAVGRGHLRGISDGCRYPLFQNLGSGSVACALQASGTVQASEAVSREIAAGCDLAVISKFGKLEAETRSGLISAFIAAVEAGVPVLTSVAPKFDAAWARFAGPLFTTLPAEAHAIEQWWGDVRACQRRSSQIMQD